MFGAGIGLLAKRVVQMKLLQPVSRAERRWVIRIALFLAMLTLLPYIIAYAAQGDQARFSGFLFSVEDGNSYIAKMLGGSYGAWLFRTPYTTYSQPGIFLYPFYLVLGKLAAPPALHEQLVILYHLFRLIAAFLMILATFDFITLFVTAPGMRRFALLLAILGGGLGWVLTALGRTEWLGSLPLEYYSPETFGFLGMLSLPHLALARAAFLWGLVIFLRATADPQAGWLKPGLQAGLLWLGCGFAQPLTGILALCLAVLYLAVVAVWVVLQPGQSNWENWRRAFRMVLVAGAFLAPLAGYNFYALFADPFTQAWTEQNRLPSPHPFHYLLAYGLVLPFAWAGLRSLWRKSAEWAVFSLAWIIVLIILAYLPFNLQRRLVEGGWVMLVALAVLGLETISVQLKAGRWQKGWIYLPLCLAFPSTLILFSGSILTAIQPLAPIFIPAAEAAFFDRLAVDARPGMVILAAYPTGNALAAYAPFQFVIGHSSETIGFKDLQNEVASFYHASTTDLERYKLLREYGVDYVFWGPQEQALNGRDSWEPRNSGFLSLWIEQGDYTMYQVRDSYVWLEASP